MGTSALQCACVCPEGDSDMEPACADGKMVTVHFLEEGTAPAPVCALTVQLLDWLTGQLSARGTRRLAQLLRCDNMGF